MIVALQDFRMAGLIAKFNNHSRNPAILQSVNVTGVDTCQSDRRS